MIAVQSKAQQKNKIELNLIVKWVDLFFLWL